MKQIKPGGKLESIVSLYHGIIYNKSHIQIAALAFGNAYMLTENYPACPFILVNIAGLMGIIPPLVDGIAEVYSLNKNNKAI